MFAAVPEKDLRLLGRTAREMTYEAGTRLASQDELGVTFFVVLEGEAEVSVSGQERAPPGAGNGLGRCR